MSDKPRTCWRCKQTLKHWIEECPGCHGKLRETLEGILKYVEGNRCGSCEAVKAMVEEGLEVE